MGFNSGLKGLKGKCHYDAINLTSEEYVSYPTASCCECTTHIQYIYYNRRYFLTDRINVLQNMWQLSAYDTVTSVEVKMVSSRRI
jgi:hypothetical protein